MDLVIDVHCHVFTADDLPVRGFLRAHGFPDAVASVIDALVQKLSRGREYPEALSADVTERAREALLAARAPALAHFELPDGARTLDTAWHRVEWAKLLTHTRTQIAERMLRTYRGVALFTPLLVDMECWLDDPVPSSLETQIAQMAHLVRHFRGTVHPFAPFDPRRAARAPDGGDALLALVRRAVTEQGFLGVKLYPPMGFRPTGNAEIHGEEGERYDAVLHRLYRWCAEEEVPITAHCTPAGAEASERAGLRASPGGWARVLARFPRLRLNLAHFGGVDGLTPPTDRRGWAWTIAGLMRMHPNVYADTGYHALFANPALRDRYLERLAALFAHFPTARERLMYGSDWHMIVLEGIAERYLKDYRGHYARRFGEGWAAHFLGHNAASFLALGPAGAGRRRLAAYYAQSGVTPPAWFTGIP